MAGRLQLHSVIPSIALLCFCLTGPLCNAQDEAAPTSSPATAPAMSNPPPRPPPPPPRHGDNFGDDNHPFDGGGRPFKRNGDGGGGDPFKKPEFSDLSKIFDHLTPEQQEKFRENFQRWQNMPPAERNALREREDFRRQRMLQEVDRAIQESGLQLDDQTKQMYVARYTQERQAIEQQLQKEMEEKRRPLLRELNNRLKAEFRAMASASPSPAPAASSSASPIPATSATGSTPQ